MVFVNGFIILFFLWLLRNALGNLVYRLSFGRMSMDQSRHAVNVFGAIIGYTAIGLFFAVLWKVGFLGAVAHNLGVFFGSIWELLCMLPKLLWWLVS
jgi:hypothetical protein